MQRYFVDIDRNGKIVFTEQDVFHISKVMRFKVDDQIEVVNDSKVYLVNIDSINPLNVHIIKNLECNAELPSKVTLFIPLLKSDKSELIIQKATELGVSSIIFFNSKRSIIKLDDKDFNKKLVRYNAIAKEASEQCHRNIIPSISGVINLSNIDKYMCDTNLFAYEVTHGSTSSLYDSIKNHGSYSIIVGPEGGFDESEAKILLEKKFIPVSLGNRILRVETAAIYSLSVIAFNLEK